jgi:hypothetical protein
MEKNVKCAESLVVATFEMAKTSIFGRACGLGPGVGGSNPLAPTINTEKCRPGTSWTKSGHLIHSVIDHRGSNNYVF